MSDEIDAKMASLRQLANEYVAMLATMRAYNSGADGSLLTERDRRIIGSVVDEAERLITAMLPSLDTRMPDPGLAPLIFLVNAWMEKAKKALEAGKPVPANPLFD